MMLAYLLLLGALLTTALGQVFFKHYHLTRRPLSLVLAVGLFLVTPPMTLLAVHRLGVGTVYVSTGLTYGLVAFLGWTVLGEHVSRRQVTGLALIMLGCLTYAF